MWPEFFQIGLPSLHTLSKFRFSHSGLTAFYLIHLLLPILFKYSHQLNENVNQHAAFQGKGVKQ